MTSPARRHFQTVTAGAAAVGAVDPAAQTLQARYKTLLDAHRATLSKLQSTKGKIEAKRAFLGEYVPYVDGVLDADAGGDDVVLVMVMVWRIDVGDFAGAMAIARHAIRHRLTLPERFKRDLPATVVEEIAQALLADPGLDGAVDALLEALDLAAAEDMVDEIRAKAHKALGLALKDKAPAAALLHLRQALGFGGSGVKTVIGQLEKALDAQAAPGPADETNETGARTDTPADPLPPV